MKRWLGIACVAWLWVAPSSARADEENGNVARARFTSSASRDVIEAAACALPTLSSADGNVQTLDVRVGERRCSVEPPAADSLELTFRIAPTDDGAQSQITIQAVAPDGFRIDRAWAIVREARDDITHRLEAAHAMSTPAPVQNRAADDVVGEPRTIEEFRTRMSRLRRALGVARRHHDKAAIADIDQKIAPLDVWGRQHIQRQEAVALDAGLAMLVLGGATLFGGLAVFAAGELSNCRSSPPGLSFGSLGPDCAGNPTVTIAGGLMMICGGLSALLSIPLMVVGNAKVVTAPHARIDVGPARIGLSVSF